MNAIDIIRQSNLWNAMKRHWWSPSVHWKKVELFASKQVTTIFRLVGGDHGRRRSGVLLHAYIIKTTLYEQNVDFTSGLSTDVLWYYRPSVVTSYNCIRPKVRFSVLARDYRSPVGLNPRKNGSGHWLRPNHTFHHLVWIILRHSLLWLFRRVLNFVSKNTRKTCFVFRFLIRCFDVVPQRRLDCWGKKRRT